MLKGDLVTTPMPAILRQLADGVASGCLHVDDGVGGEAKVYVRGGQVYAVNVPGRRPQLGARLVSSGALGPEALAEALEAQRTELQGWRLGELLVHLGYVDQPIVEAFVNEQVRESTSDLMRWPTGTWKFRVNERTREDVAPPTSVEALLAEVAQRQAEWETITEAVHGPDAVPLLGAGSTDAEMAIDPEAWSLLCKVDGVRSIAELARECGFTLFEAGQVVYSLVRSGLLEVEEVLTGPEPVAAAPAGSITSRLAAAFAPAPAAFVPEQAAAPSPAEVAHLITEVPCEDRTSADLLAAAEDDVQGSISRVSAALNALLGPTTDESLFAPKPRKQAKPPLTAAEAERAAKRAEKAARDAKRREQDAAELATAQAELEAARAAGTRSFAADHEAEIVDFQEVRREAARRDEEEAAEAARLEAATAARRAAEAEETARLEAEAAAAERARAEAEATEAARLAAEAEAARLEAEAEAARVAAEAEAARLEAEAAAAEQARAEAEAAEEARLAAEAAEAARLEAEAEAAEQARIDAQAAEEARLAEEAEAARLAAEAAEVRREEEARLAAEQTSARAQVEEELRLASREQAAAEAANVARQAELDAEKAWAAAAAEAEAEAEEQARLAEQRAGASSAFAELSATAASSPVPAETVPESRTSEDNAQAYAAEEPLPTYGRPDTDMASLLRELSSLGLDDDPPPAPSRPAGSPRPPVATAPPKKKKGLFGRG